MFVNKKAWYAIAVTGGKEIKTRNWLIANKNKFGVSDEVLDEVVVPIQRKITVKNGKKRISESSLMGPYIYVHANISDKNVISFFSQAPNVYSFVGCKNKGFTSGADVISDEEINKIMHNSKNEVTNENIKFFIGDAVEVVSGSFSSFKGIIKETNDKTNILSVSVMIFGGENIIEVKSSQVRKIDKYEQ